MLIRLTTSIASPSFSHDEGEIVDWPDAEAIRLIRSGAAVPHAEPAIERAILPEAPERRGRRHRGRS